MQKVWLSFFIPTIGTNVPNDEQDISTVGPRLSESPLSEPLVIQTLL